MTNNPTQSRPAADLQGLRDALLAPHPAHRDPSGWLAHPAFPVFDEDVNTRFLLKAFGLEAAFVLMSDECDIDDTEACEGNCSAWTPTPPDGEGWALTEIYDTEDGPCALFVRESKIARSRRCPARADPDGQAEWRAAAAIYDHFDVDKALRTLIADPTDYNATCAVRSVLRVTASTAEPKAAPALINEFEAAYAAWNASPMENQPREHYRIAREMLLAALARPAQAPAETQSARETAHVSWSWLRGVICDLPSTPSGYRRLVALHDVLAWIDEAELRAVLATATQAAAGGAWKFNALYADTEVRRIADDKLLAVIHAGPERRHIVAALKSHPANANAAKSFCDTLDSTSWRRLMAFRDVSAERNRQDAQWGGPSHDDLHDPVDWARLIEHQADWSREQEPRRRFVKIAALAVASIESIDRKAAERRNP